MLLRENILFNKANWLFKTSACYYQKRKDIIQSIFFCLMSLLNSMKFNYTSWPLLFNMYIFLLCFIHQAHHPNKESHNRYSFFMEHCYVQYSFLQSTPSLANGVSSYSILWILTHKVRLGNNGYGCGFDFPLPPNSLPWKEAILFSKGMCSKTFRWQEVNPV